MSQFSKTGHNVIWNTHTAVKKHKQASSVNFPSADSKRWKKDSRYVIFSCSRSVASHGETQSSSHSLPDCENQSTWPSAITFWHSRVRDGRMRWIVYYWKVGKCWNMMDAKDFMFFECFRNFGLSRFTNLKYSRWLEFLYHKNSRPKWQKFLKTRPISNKNVTLSTNSSKSGGNVATPTPPYGDATADCPS